MNITLLIENNPKIASFYALNLSTWLGLETSPHKSGESAIKKLEDNFQVQLIITRKKIGTEETAKLLIENLEKKGLNIPVIVIGQGEVVSGAFAQIPNSLDIKSLIKTCAQALNITAKEMMSKVIPDFFPVPIAYFTVLRRSVCNVYSQSTENPKKYDLQIEKMKEFTPHFIQSLSQGGAQYLYIDKMDRLDFVNNVTSELIALLKEEELSEDEQISAGEKNLELVARKLQTMGVTEETIVLAKKNIETFKANARKHPKLSKLIDKLLSNKTSYLFQHTQILTYVSLHIIRNIDWGTPEQEDKISFISFFHDIALETDEQSMIHSTAELKKSNLTTEERQLVERHAQAAAELVVKFPHAPMGADQIIRQHHGTLNGVGFSEHYGANISPMAVVFIIAEEFTRIIMKKESGPFDRSEMLRELKEEFPTSRFQKILDLLTTITF